MLYPSDRAFSEGLIFPVRVPGPIDIPGIPLTVFETGAVCVWLTELIDDNEVIPKAPVLLTVGEKLANVGLVAAA